MSMNRKISIQLQGKRHIPFEAGDHEGSITWTLRVKQAPAHIPAAWSGTYGIVELAASGTRKGKPILVTTISLNKTLLSVRN
jgi:hypothetical protein